MFNATLIVIEAFIRELRTMYERTYGTMEPGYPGVISFVAQLALENIATSDAAYHDVNHTIMVSLVGQEILRGRHISVGGVTPRDWLHFIISLLCHDIGYVRGICRGDGDGSYVTNLAGDKVTLPEGATDASMTPYHVARSKLFVRERSAKALVHLDTAAPTLYWRCLALPSSHARGSLAAAARSSWDVRFTPNSCRGCRRPARQLRAISGHRATYSITSSARASNDGGTVRPSAFTVLRLTTSSYLVGC